MARISRRSAAWLAALLAAVLLVLPLLLRAREEPAPSGVPDAVFAYASALEALDADGGPNGSVERVYQLGLGAARDLTRSPGPGKPSTLEQLSDDEFATLEQRMRGFRIFRDEFVGASPIPAFFLGLAKSRGSEADVSYFTLADASKNEWGDARYVKRRSDFGGCTRYGSLILVDLYRRWTRYSDRFPGRYEREVAKFLEEIRRELGSARCACDGPDSVLKELRAFVAAYPNSEVAPAVEKRIEDIGAARSLIRFQCGAR